jgi:hypothetical protein
VVGKCATTTSKEQTFPPTALRKNKNRQQPQTATKATTNAHPQTATATECQLQLEKAADKVVYSKPPQLLTKRTKK